MARYVCRNEGRRKAVRESAGLNGIDFLEVGPGQTALSVHFVKTPPPAVVESWEVRIEGGVRVKDVRIVSTALTADGVLEATVNHPGDFSPYVLRLVEPEPQAGNEILLDPRLSEIRFSFKVDCPGDFDCKRAAPPPLLGVQGPVLDYLAKDYASFRRLMLDRMSAIAPDWRERNSADLGVALVELLAYVGDQLSYYQDAVATEAYLGTARLRTSVRRHARLLDYHVHEGTNARAWVVIDADGAAGLTLPARTPVITGEGGPMLPPAELASAVAAGEMVFETMHDLVLRAPGRLAFHTWSDSECRLPAGATAATLEGPAPGLSPDVFLLFEDARSCHVVRLTGVKPARDLVENRDVVEIEWHPADALPSPLDLTTAVARRNVVLADHGRTVELEDVGDVFPGPITRAELLSASPASRLLEQRPEEADPQIWLWDKITHERWEPRRDLLGSGSTDCHFVVEVENDGRARLRFGDGEHGRTPDLSHGFRAVLRLGNGAAGNVGAGTLRRIAIDTKLLRLDESLPAGDREADRQRRAEELRRGILRVSNPFPAAGGREPESLDEVRLRAPHAFRIQQRAVTPEDWAEVARRHPEVQRAAAALRWTGSWTTVFLTVDRVGGGEVDAGFEEELRRFLEPFRLAGYDLEIDAPRYVSLELALRVCLLPGVVRGQVAEALLAKLGRLFHPDDWTFGQPVHLSRIYAVASEIDGIESVLVTRFHPRGRRPGREIADGVLKVGRLEIVRLDNDPNFPENGRIELDLRGGR